MARNAVEFMGTPDELYHWIPGEMVVVVRLSRTPANDILAELIEQVRLQLNKVLAPYNLTLEAYGTSGRWRDNPTMPPIRRRAFIFGSHRNQPLIAIFFHTRHADPTVRDHLPVALSYLQGNLEQLAQAG